MGRVSLPELYTRKQMLDLSHAAFRLHIAVLDELRGTDSEDNKITKIEAHGVARSHRIIATAIGELLRAGFWKARGPEYEILDYKQCIQTSTKYVQRFRERQREKKLSKGQEIFQRLPETLRNELIAMSENADLDKDKDAQAHALARVCAYLLDRPIRVDWSQDLAAFDFPFERKLETINMAVETAKVLGTPITSLKYLRQPFQMAESLYHRQAN